MKGEFKMKKSIAVLVSIFMMLGLSLTGCAAEQPEQQQNNTDEITITLQIDNPMMTVNGTEREIDPGRGTVPVIVNDARTLLPVRAVVEAIGGTVDWDENTNTAILTYDSDVISFTIDSATAYLNGEAQTLDVAPTTINDRTMLPIRFIAESFGFNVGWDEPERIVTVTNSESPQYDSDLVLIKGGTFRMGSPEDEPERGADEIAHDVTIGSFYMSKTELSQKDYQAVTGANPSENVGDDLPVTNIS